MWKGRSRWLRANGRGTGSGQGPSSFQLKSATLSYLRQLPFGCHVGFQQDELIDITSLFTSASSGVVYKQELMGP